MSAALALAATDAQWEAYYAACADAHRAKAAHCRAEAAAYRLNPLGDTNGMALHFDGLAADYDRMAAECLEVDA